MQIRFLPNIMRNSTVNVGEYSFTLVQNKRGHWVADIPPSPALNMILSMTDTYVPYDEEKEAMLEKERKKRGEEERPTIVGEQDAYAARQAALQAEEDALRRKAEERAEKDRAKERVKRLKEDQAVKDAGGMPDEDAEKPVADKKLQNHPEGIKLPAKEQPREDKKLDLKKAD